MTAPKTTSQRTLAYLVPEFPGQTHAFFWREIEALEAAGITVDLLSTTPPAYGLVDHPWRPLATARTTYLARPSPGDALRGVRALAAATASGRLAAAIGRARGGAPVERAKVLLAAAVLAGRARAHGWTHVHVHSSGNSARVAMVASAIADLTYSVTLHGPLADYGPQQREKWVNATFGLVITERLREELTRTLGAGIADRVRLAPMGIRLADTERSQAYQPWAGEGEARLFSCGRLNPAKGHEVLIRAVRILVDGGVPTHLSIAGEDERGGAGYRHHLERLIDELGVRSHVTLLGAVGEDAVRAQLEQAHVFVLASRGEPLGVAIMEAMGAAVPVVVGDGGGVRELITPGTGLLVDAADPRAVAEAVRVRVRSRGRAARASCVVVIAPSPQVSGRSAS